MINKFLKSIHIQYLQNAFDTILDDIKQDITILSKNKNDGELTYLWTILPPLGKASLDINMAFNLLITFLNIIYKFYNKKKLILGNTAEEIIFYHCLELAKDTAEENQESIDEYEEYFTCIYQDTDFLFLYDYKADGIESTDIGEQLGITYLSPSDWFKPFNNTPRKPHPVFWNKEDKMNFYKNKGKNE